MGKERGIIVRGGMGGFLNPPTHPEHNLSVEFDLRRRKENRGSCSLSAAVDMAWLDDAIRAAAKHRIESWQRPPLDSPEVQEWILQVLGYFRNCYRGDGPEPECWNAGKLRIVKSGDDERPTEEHAGVHLIRKYYPEYEPTGEQLSAAYWGTKPQKVA